MARLTGLPLLALIFSAIGFLGFFTLPIFIKNIIDQKFVLANGSTIYPMWRDMPLPVYHRFYFYNITNPHEVEFGGAKPKLSEIGPFTYRVKFQKTPKVNPNGTISFIQSKYWFFDSDRSPMNENTVIFTINAPLVITLSLYKKSKLPENKEIEEMLAILDHGFIIKKSIKELTFLGYQDILIQFGTMFAPKATAGYNGKFGYFLTKNGSNDGPFTVYSGLNDMSKINLVTRLNGQDKLNIWKDGKDKNGYFYCNRFNDSTTGELFPSLKDHYTPVIKVYLPDLHRTLSLRHQKSHFIFKGLETWRYAFSMNNFANPLTYPPNACYNSQLTNHSFDGINTTLPSGVFDSSTPNYGLPVFMSLPHFYGADPYFLTRIDGLFPNESLHSTWFEVEPTLGITAATRICLQLNLGVLDSKLFSRPHRMPNIVFPVFWMELSVSFNQDIVDQLIIVNSMLYILPLFVFAFSAGIASLFLFIASLKFIIIRRRVRIVGCLNLLTCQLTKSVKDDEQDILTSDETDATQSETQPT